MCPELLGHSSNTLLGRVEAEFLKKNVYNKGYLKKVIKEFFFKDETMP